MGSHSLLQGSFLTQGSNLDFLHCRQILDHLIHQGSPSPALPLNEISSKSKGWDRRRMTPSSQSPSFTGWPETPYRWDERVGLAGERGYEGPKRDPGCGELLLRAELRVEEVPGPREAALGTMTQAPSPHHSGLLSELLLNSALHGRQSGLSKASTMSLPCFRVLPRLSCDGPGPSPHCSGWPPIRTCGLRLTRQPQ